MAPVFWELNWGGAPLGAFYEIGGFPEEHDGQFYSCDNLTIAFCSQELGYRFYLDRTNECCLVENNDVFPKPSDWYERHGRLGPWDRWYEDWRAKGCPRFPYLSAAIPPPDRPSAADSTSRLPSREVTDRSHRRRPSSRAAIRRGSHVGAKGGA